MYLTVHINDRNYTSWEYRNGVDDSIGSEPTITPLEQKLFHGDQIDQEDYSLHVSPTRQDRYLSGVLILAGNKTYGRTPNKKRLYYRVIPESTHLPCFLVPYDVNPGFIKVLTNKYILFAFDNWISEHPIGQLVEVLGNVDNLDVYCEYQLYNKHLNGSIQAFAKYTHSQTSDQTQHSPIEDAIYRKTHDIEDRTHLSNIWTMDPANTMDFDDAIHYESTDAQTKITVYLADVFTWMEEFQLWHMFGGRIATMYLPDRRRPMLPTALSENWCSLRQGEFRCAMGIEFCYDASTTSTAPSISFHSTVIRVHQNHVYESRPLLDDPTYQQLRTFTETVARDNIGTVNGSETSPKVHMTSQDVVAYWMVAVNTAAAKHLYQHQTGIYRTSHVLSQEGRWNRSAEDTMQIQQWMSQSSQYALHADQISTYVHITSPIRRLVDLINQMMMYKTLQRTWSEAATQFVDKWTQQLDTINTHMRSIRKVQTQCTLLHKLAKTPNLTEQTYSGVVFEKCERQPGLFQYTVYLEGLKCVSQVKSSCNVDLNTRHDFHIHLFESEYQTKKKIRVEFST